MSGEFSRCPEGHTLPRKGRNGQCTPIYCGGTHAGGKPTNEALALREAEEARPLDDVADEAYKQEDKRLSRADGRNRALAKRLSTPEGLEGDAAEKYADGELIKLLPEAVGVIKRLLRYGDDKQQIDAADKVLRATGRSQREAAAGAGAVIILQTPEGFSLPWAARIQQSPGAPANVQVVEGELSVRGERVQEGHQAAPGSVPDNQQPVPGPNVEGHERAGDSGAGEAVRLPGETAPEGE